MTYWANMGTKWFGGQEVADRMLHRYKMGQFGFPFKWNVTLGECCFNVVKPYHWIVILAQPGSDMVVRPSYW